MKKPVVIWALAAVVVLIGVLAIAFVPRRERVSLTLLQYQRWPHGATLKLSNDTRRTITYFTEQGGGPTLFLKKTTEGWTNTSLPLMSVSAWDPRSGKSTEIYVFDYSSPLKVGERVGAARSRELKPGQSAQVYVGLEPDGPPIRVGILCRVRQGPVGQRLGKWVGWLKERCHMKSRLPGEIEVWCSEPLQVTAKPTRAEKE